MKIAVREATVHELPDINQLLRLSKGHWGYDEAFLDRFIAKLGITLSYMEQHAIQLVYLDGELAGFYNFLTGSEEAFELDNFFLHPDYIGRGMGRKLWEVCCADAIKQGKDEFILMIDPHAENFYLKMGCERIGARPSPMHPGRDSPVLKFKLARYKK